MAWSRTAAGLMAFGFVVDRTAVLLPGGAAASSNFAGGQLGARIALRYGNEFIRTAFYVVVALLIAKTFKDAYL